MPIMQQKIAMRIIQVFKTLFLLCFFFGKNDVEHDRYQGSRHDAGAAEDQLYKLGQTGDHGAVGTKTVTKSQCNGNNGDGTGGHGLLCDQLDSADDDGGKHHDGSTAKDTLRHDGD